MSASDSQTAVDILVVGWGVIGVLLMPSVWFHVIRISRGQSAEGPVAGALYLLLLTAVMLFFVASIIASVVLVARFAGLSV